MELIEEYLEHLRRKYRSRKTIQRTEVVMNLCTGFISLNYNKSVLKSSAEEIESYLAYRRERLDITTVIREITILRGFYEYYRKKGDILINPMELMEPVRRGRRIPKNVPDEETVKVLLSQPDEYTYKGIMDKAVMELFYSSGLRKGELRNLKLNDIDLKERMVRVYRGKGYKDRIVPVGRGAIEAIEKYLRVTRKKFSKRPEINTLFVTEHGNMLNDVYVDRIFKRHRDKSNLTKNITAHMLRHACALHMLRGGASIEIVRQMLGHSRLETTQVYTRLYPKDLKYMHKKCHPREKKRKKAGTEE